MLLVTHDERVAARCDRVVVMEDGRIRADAVPPAPKAPLAARRAP
jgi:ABC-type lipoprotein export system ATPase subunit